MQIQHVSVTLSSFENPTEGDFAASVGVVTEHLVPIIGTSGVWDAWLAPSSNLGDFNGFSDLAIEPIAEDSTHVLLKVKAAAADKRLGLRIYVLSQ